MTRDEILARLKEREPDLRAEGITRAALFGSIARGDQRSDSDIDIMVEIDPECRMDLFRYVGIVQYIEDMFSTRVDVVNRDGLKAFVRPNV